jgi:hypothetical protein
MRVGNTADMQNDRRWSRLVHEQVATMADTPFICDGSGICAPLSQNEYHPRTTVSGHPVFDRQFATDPSRSGALRCELEVGKSNREQRVDEHGRPTQRVDAAAHLTLQCNEEADYVGNQACKQD